MRRRRRRHTRPVAGIVALLAAVSSLAFAHSGGSAHASAATWSLPYPQTISYRTLGSDPNIKCNQPDSVFDQQVTAEKLDGYEIYVVAGVRGSCARLKGEQMKRLHPEKMVLVYESPTAESPAAWPGGTWAGYYLMLGRTTALASVNNVQTQISVANGGLFHVGDTAVMWLPTPSDPFANSEWVTVNAINGSTLTITRNIFGTGVQSYAVAPLVAPAATGSGYPLPMANLSAVAPVNPANGLRANQWLASAIASDFAASTSGAPALDGMELDSASSTPPAHGNYGPIDNFDCNGDGIVDYCQANTGTNQQVDSYGVGYDQFVQMLKQQLTTYDTDPARPSKLLLADGEEGLRSVGSLDGAEFESFPDWDNYTYSSSALATLGVWQSDAGAAGDHLSYAFTKDATPLYPGSGCVTPANGGTCRNADYRYGMASALVSGGASTYNDEATFNSSQPWDEEATVNRYTTGLQPGYLGSPLGPATRVTAYSSSELAVNGDFESGLTGVVAKTFTPGAISVAQDTTTSAPGWGGASLQMAVSRIAAVPTPSDSRVFASLSSSLSPGEYTVEFWAKAQNTAQGPAALNLSVALAGVGGAPLSVLATNQWTHYYLQFDATSTTPRAFVKFLLGDGVGQYWVDGLSVHRGSAGVITRQFTNGIVVLNDSFTTQSNIPLPGGPYHHINGVQDRTVNNGASVGSVLPSIGSKDGVILLRG